MRACAERWRPLVSENRLLIDAGQSRLNVWQDWHGHSGVVSKTVSSLRRLLSDLSFMFQLRGLVQCETNSGKTLIRPSSLFIDEVWSPELQHPSSSFLPQFEAQISASTVASESFRREVHESRRPIPA